MPHLRDLLEASAGFTLLAAAVWIAGSGLAPARPAGERLAFGILAALAAAWCAMLAGQVGMGVLGYPWLLRLVVALGLGACAARAGAVLRPTRPPLLPAVPTVLISVALAWPLLRVTSHGLGGGDMLWHLGWIRQLSGGLAEPGGPYAGVPDAYPWLYHALVAGIGQTLPGELPPAFLVLQLSGTAALAIGIWLLGRALGFAGAPATWSVVIALGGGGAGWLYAQRIAASPNMNDHARRLFHGDLVLSPAPTPALANVAPLLPRDLGIALAPLVIWFGVTALRERRPGIELAAGAMVAFLTLLAPVAGLFAVVALSSVAIVVRRLPSIVIVAAAAGVLVWLVPLLRDAHRLGGLRSTSTIPPVSPSAADSLVIFGLILPLAVVGVAAGARRSGIDRRVGAALLAACLATLFLALTLEGDATHTLPALARGVRYLALAAVGLSLPAGLGAAAVMQTIARRPARVLATGVLASLLLASAADGSVWQARNLERRAAADSFGCFDEARLSARDTVVAPADEVGLRVFAQTGAHVLYLSRPRLRFRRVPRDVPGQAARRALQRAVLYGSRPPVAVGWVFAPRADAASSWERQVAVCTAGARRFVLYRVTAGPTATRANE
jgi:hypothetical protein